MILFMQATESRKKLNAVSTGLSCSPLSLPPPPLPFSSSPLFLLSSPPLLSSSSPLPLVSSPFLSSSSLPLTHTHTDYPCLSLWQLISLLFSHLSIFLSFSLSPTLPPSLQGCAHPPWIHGVGLQHCGR